MSITRRKLLGQALAGVGVAGLATLMPRFAYAERPAIAGFAPEPWFAHTTLNLSQDLAAAKKADKYLVLLWEQKGCHYCHELHTVNFQEPEIIALGKKHFHTMQMDLWGKREFIDFDGNTRAEAEIANARRVHATPVMLFFDGDGQEVFRMPGYAPPSLFLAAYEYVVDKGYETSSLRAWMMARNL